MPFRSEAQRRYLWQHDPELAKKWAHEYPDQGKLPKHVKKPSPWLDMGKKEKKP